MNPGPLDPPIIRAKLWWTVLILIIFLPRPGWALALKVVSVKQPQNTIMINGGQDKGLINYGVVSVYQPTVVNGKSTFVASKKKWVGTFLVVTVYPHKSLAIPMAGNQRVKAISGAYAIWNSTKKKTAPPGRLQRRAVDLSIQNQFPKLKQCYAQHLKEQVAGSKGRVLTSFVVGEAGNIIYCNANALNYQVAKRKQWYHICNCFCREIKKLVFDYNDGYTIVSFPFAFK